MEDKFEDLTDDEIIFFRENYKTTGYLPDAKTFGRTPADRAKYKETLDKSFVDAFKSVKK